MTLKGRFHRLVTRQPGARLSRRWLGGDPHISPTLHPPCFRGGCHTVLGGTDYFDYSLYEDHYIWPLNPHSPGTPLPELLDSPRDPAGHIAPWLPADRSSCFRTTVYQIQSGPKWNMMGKLNFILRHSRRAIRSLKKSFGPTSGHPKHSNSVNHSWIICTFVPPSSSFPWYVCRFLDLLHQLQQAAHLFRILPHGKGTRHPSPSTVNLNPQTSVRTI